MWLPSGVGCLRAWVALGHLLLPSGVCGCLRGGSALCCWALLAFGRVGSCVGLRPAVGCCFGVVLGLIYGWLGARVLFWGFGLLVSGLGRGCCQPLVGAAPVSVSQWWAISFPVASCG